jgi:hypothetical protein
MPVLRIDHRTAGFDGGRDLDIDSVDDLLAALDVLTARGVSEVVLHIDD